MTHAALPVPGGGLLARSAHLRGVLLPITIGIAARFVSEHHGGSALLYALLLGMVLNFLHEQPQIRQAALWCSSRGLRLGVALLGARITWAQCEALGLPTALMLVACLVLTLLLSVMVARLMRWNVADAIVAGGAVGICGASAAMALADALPRRQLGASSTLLIVITVTCLSTTAMVVYPVLLRLLGVPDPVAGVFLGATIHDVAQVIGAGYDMGPVAGDAASVTKMMRVALLVPTVLLVGWWWRRRPVDAVAAPASRPWFLLGFAVLMALNSLGMLAQPLQGVLVWVSQYLVLIAVAAWGLRTSIGDLASQGWRLPALLVLDTVGIAVAAGLALRLMH